MKKQEVFVKKKKKGLPPINSNPFKTDNKETTSKFIAYQHRCNFY